MYPELKNLAKSGLIQSTPFEETTRGKVKYSITESGRDVLQVISFGEKVYCAYLDWSAEAVAYLKGRNKK